MISVVIVQHNHSRLTWEAVGSLRSHERGGFEVIVVDNGSEEPDARAIPPELDRVKVIPSEENIGFGAANNRGAAQARGDILLFLNTDTQLTGPILADVEDHFRTHPKCGIAGLALSNADGTAQPSSGRFPTVRSEWRTKRRVNLSDQQADWVTGAALAVRRDVFEMMGGFDERFFLYFEDIDLFRRVRTGAWEVDVLRTAPVIHLRGGSRSEGREDRVLVEYRRSQLRYYALHNSPAQNVLLRCYLFLKFLGRALAGAR
jgi:GT2 family glycosyltransferase